MRTEVEKAKSFTPQLSHFTIATSGPRDAYIQQVARTLSDEHRKIGLFPVDVWSWEDIVESLESYPEVIAKHYPDFALTANVQQGFDRILSNNQSFCITTHYNEHERRNVVQCKYYGRPIVPVWLRENPERLCSPWLVKRLLNNSELQLYFDPNWCDGTYFVVDVQLGDGVVLNSDQFDEIRPSSPTTTTTLAPRSDTKRSSNATTGNPIHNLLDRLTAFSKMFWDWHHASTSEALNKAIDTQQALSQPLWKPHPFQGLEDAVRWLADPALAWLTRQGFQRPEYAELVEEAAEAIVGIAQSSFTAMPKVYSTTYTTEEKLWSRWHEQGEKLLAVRRLIHRVQRLAALTKEPWPQTDLKPGPSSAELILSIEEEPTLKPDLYEHILRLMSDAGVEMKRHPSIYDGKGEETLRDHFLMVLSPHFQSTTGETYNKKGKTDILIRHEKENVFVAECKFWSGIKGFHQTIDQLLGYLTWRDSKAAVVSFVRNKELTPVLEAIEKETPSHGCFVKYHGKKKDGWFMFEFHLPGDAGRNVQIAVLVFHFP